MREDVTPFPPADGCRSDATDVEEAEEFAGLRRLATDGGCIRCWFGVSSPPLLVGLPLLLPLLLPMPRALRDRGRVLIICMSNPDTPTIDGELADEASRDNNTARDGVMPFGAFNVARY